MLWSDNMLVEETKDSVFWRDIECNTEEMNAFFEKC